MEVLQSVLNDRRAIRSKASSSKKGKDMMDNLIDVVDENGNKLTDEEING